MSEQRLFISHASEDAAVADRIVAYLEARGVPCWISSRDILPRAIYADAITGAMQACSACAVLVSKASNQSKAVKRELELASHYDRPFIPIRIDGSEPAAGVDYYLRNTQWLDFKRDGERALDRISAHVQGLPPPKPRAARKRVPTIALVGGGAAITVAILAWLVSTPGIIGGVAADPDISELSGQYIWDGVACGDGPSISMSDGDLIFTMPDTPTFRHRILRVQHNVRQHALRIETRVVAPAEQAGATYFIGRREGGSELDVVSNEGSFIWRYCAPPISPDAGFSSLAAEILGTEQAPVLGRRTIPIGADFGSGTFLASREDDPRGRWAITLERNYLYYDVGGRRISAPVSLRENYENGMVVQAGEVAVAIYRRECTDPPDRVSGYVLLVMYSSQIFDACARPQA